MSPYSSHGRGRAGEVAMIQCIIAPSSGWATNGTPCTGKRNSIAQRCKAGPGFSSEHSETRKAAPIPEVTRDVDSGSRANQPLTTLWDSPLPGIGHRGPRLLRRQGVALLQELNRDIVG